MSAEELEQTRLMSLSDEELLKEIAKPAIPAVPVTVVKTEPEKPPVSEDTPEKRIKDLEAKMAKDAENAQKRVADAQRALHEKAQKLSALEKEFQATQRKLNQPEFFKENPELADAVEKTIEARLSDSQPVPTATEQAERVQAEWFRSLQDSLSEEGEDFMKLAADPVMRGKLMGLKDSMGAKWDNAATAAVKVLKLVTETRQEAARAEETERVRQEKLAAQESPPSKPSSRPSSPAAAVQAAQLADEISDMSDADFEKLKRNPGAFNAKLRAVQ